VVDDNRRTTKWAEQGAVEGGGGASRGTIFRNSGVTELKRPKGGDAAAKRRQGSAYRRRDVSRAIIEANRLVERAVIIV
jgi:hypothetical protein